MIAMAVGLCANAQAAWFESTGQAAIFDGNIELARQNATQEAIKQALLFAGASVTSVQKMANGVLQNDDLTIRASGEVSSIELIEEQHANGIVSISIRADIFSQRNHCDASSYAKTLVTTWHPLRDKHQATVGGLFALGNKLPEILQSSFQQHAQYSELSQIMPFEYVQEKPLEYSQISILAKQANAQYVLLAEVTDISISAVVTPAWQFWDTGRSERQFAYKVSVLDGFTGSLVWQKDYSVSAPWDFDLHKNIDVNSNLLWQSQYGKSIQKLLVDVATQVDETLACQPAYGRILKVQNDRLMVNIGKNQGLQRGDILQLFQMTQVHDQLGQIHAMFSLHPTAVMIESINPDSAIAVSKDGSYLANIQANDFVSIN
jgi:hypothetical protein